MFSFYVYYLSMLVVVKAKLIYGYYCCFIRNQYELLGYSVVVCSKMVELRTLA